MRNLCALIYQSRKYTATSFLSVINVIPAGLQIHSLIVSLSVFLWPSCIPDFVCPCLFLFKCSKFTTVSSEVWWNSCASGKLITWPGDPNKSDSSKFWSGASQIPSPPQYQRSLNLLTRLPLFASLAPAFTVGYFNIRDERRNPFLTFVSFIWVFHNGFKVSCLSIHSVQANLRIMQWEREKSIYVCMWLFLWVQMWR